MSFAQNFFTAVISLLILLSLGIIVFLSNPLERLPYTLFVLFGALGILQVAAAYNKLDGLLLVPHRMISGLSGLIVTIGAFIWFFASGNRNLPDTDKGLDGNEQSALFALAVLGALFLTLGLSSIINRRKVANSSQAEGLDALQVTTYFHVLNSRIRRWRQTQRRARQHGSQRRLRRLPGRFGQRWK